MKYTQKQKYEMFWNHIKAMEENLNMMIETETKLQCEYDLLKKLITEKIKENANYIKTPNYIYSFRMMEKARVELITLNKAIETEKERIKVLDDNGEEIHYKTYEEYIKGVS